MQLLARIDVAMGGRAAEELIFGKDKITGGASADLQDATKVSEVIVAGSDIPHTIFPPCIKFQFYKNVFIAPKEDLTLRTIILACTYNGSI